jgi:hypothetical protein
MKEENYKERIMEYLDGNLTAKQAEELRQALKEEGYDLSNLDEMEKLARQLEEIQPPEPREKMKEKFYQMLEEEKSRIASKERSVEALLKPLRTLLEPVYLPKMLYASLILIIGMILGHWIIPDKQFQYQTSLMMDEMQSMKKMMALTLFDQSNATDRLKAVSYTSELNDPDDKVLEALLKTLNNDPSVNVRLASLDALTRQIGNETVRIGLVKSISNQDSPLVQIAIAEWMIKVQEKRAVPELEKLLQREDLNQTVAEKITESIKILT